MENDVPEEVTISVKIVDGSVRSFQLTDAQRKAVIRALGRPLACPSANLSGQPSPKSAADVFCQLAGRIDAVLDGGACAVGVESTIVDMTAEPYRILRQGGLSREAIETALGKKLADN